MDLEERSLASLAAALCERLSTSARAGAGPGAGVNDAAALVAQMEEGSL